MRRPKIGEYTDGRDRITVTVKFTLTREETRGVFEWLDATYGYAMDEKPANLTNAMNYIRSHLHDYGENFSQDAGDEVRIDDDWVEAMTAAIWGEKDA